MSLITKLTIDDFEDFEEVLSSERRTLSAELALFRPELLDGFKSPQRKARCAAVCLRLQQIDLLLNDDEGELGA